MVGAAVATIVASRAATKRESWIKAVSSECQIYSNADTPEWLRSSFAEADIGKIRFTQYVRTARRRWHKAVTCSSSFHGSSQERPPYVAEELVYPGCGRQIHEIRTSVRLRYSVYGLGGPVVWARLGGRAPVRNCSPSLSFPLKDCHVRRSSWYTRRNHEEVDTGDVES